VYDRLWEITFSTSCIFSTSSATLTSASDKLDSLNANAVTLLHLFSCSALSNSSSVSWWCGFSIRHICLTARQQLHLFYNLVNNVLLPCYELIPVIFLLSFAISSLTARQLHCPLWSQLFVLPLIFSSIFSNILRKYSIDESRFFIVELSHSSHKYSTLEQLAAISALYTLFHKFRHAQHFQAPEAWHLSHINAHQRLSYTWYHQRLRSCNQYMMEVCQLLFLSYSFFFAAAVLSCFMSSGELLTLELDFLADLPVTLQM